MTNGPTGHSDPARQEGTATETPLADTLAAAQNEATRLRRQSAADRIRVEGADEYGNYSLRLEYSGEPGGVD